MKKIMLFIFIGIIILVLDGCSDNPPSNENAENIKPSVTILSNEGDLSNSNFFYVIDKNTGIVYLGFTAYRKAGITVMLNADGTPITYDQIKRRYEK